VANRGDSSKLFGHSNHPSNRHENFHAFCVGTRLGIGLSYDDTVDARAS
jgi:hypothetical protein